jgi:hypothetical protein
VVACCLITRDGIEISICSEKSLVRRRVHWQNDPGKDNANDCHDLYSRHPILDFTVSSHVEIVETENDDEDHKNPDLWRDTGKPNADDIGRCDKLSRDSNRLRKPV